jgi:5,10-methylenetetrahydromethanopterin reductase
MKFALGLGNQTPIESEIVLTQEAERLRLFGVAIAEHIGLSSNDVFSTVSLLSQKVQNVHFMANSVNQYSRHPITIAMAATTAAEATSGKFILGLGTGAGDSLKLMGIPDASSLSRLKEAVQITKALTQGREVAMEGKFFSIQQMKLQSSEKYDIPIYVPAIRDNAIKFAAEYSDGIFLSNCSSVKFVEYVTKLLSQYHKNDNFGMAAALTYIPAEDRKQGLWSAKMAIMRYVSIPGIGEVLLGRSGFDPSSAALIRQGKQTISDEVADALCTVGGEKALEKRMEEFQKLGVSIAIVSSPTELKKVVKDLGDLQRSF